MTVADFPDWQAPSAHAQQIAQQGVPLLTKSSSVFFAPAQVIGANGTFTRANLPVSQIGYEFVIVAQVPNTATVPFLRVRLTWNDSGSAQIVGDDYWVQPMSSVAPGWQCVGRGPSKADLVTINITNLDPAQSATVLICLLNNSRVYVTDQLFNDPLQNSSANVPGFTLPGTPPLNEMLAAVPDFSIAASGSKTWLIPPGSGVPGVISVHTGAASAGNVRTNLFPVPSSQFGTDPPLIPGAPAATDFSQQLIVPRAPMTLQVSNLATAAISTSWSLVQQL